MRQKVFIKYLFTISLISGICLLYLNALEAFKEAALFNWGIWLFFILLTTAIYSVGKKLSASKDINAYTRMIFSFMVLKMFLCIIFVLAFYKLQNPSKKTFLIPFFLIYLTFTSFEVIIMSRLGKNKVDNGIQ